jgi:CDP-diglyceride synthetase
MADLDMHTDRILSATTDSLKLQFEINKHITTLCSGSVLVIAAFVGRVVTGLAGKILVSLSLGGFIAALICAVAVMMVVGGYYEAIRDVRVTALRIDNSAGQDELSELTEELKGFNNKLDVLAKSANSYHRVRNIAFILGMVLLLAFVVVTAIYSGPHENPYVGF